MAIQEQKGYTSVELLKHIHGGIPCEICGEITAIENTHSFVVSYAMPGNSYPAYQCANEQHYGCSRDHALMAAIACTFSHILARPHDGMDQPLCDELAAIRSRLIPYIPER